MTDTRPAPDTADLIARLEVEAQMFISMPHRNVLREAAAALFDLSARLETAEALLRYYDIEKVRAYFMGSLGSEPWRERMTALETKLETAERDARRHRAALAACSCGWAALAEEQR